MKMAFNWNPHGQKKKRKTKSDLEADRGLGDILCWAGKRWREAKMIDLNRVRWK